MIYNDHWYFDHWLTGLILVIRACSQKTGKWDSFILKYERWLERVFIARLNFQLKSYTLQLYLLFQYDAWKSHILKISNTEWWNYFDSVLLFLEETIEWFTVREGDVLQWLVQKCNNRHHVFNNSRKDDRSQISELLVEIDEVVTSNGDGHFEMDPMIYLFILFFYRWSKRRKWQKTRQERGDWRHKRTTREGKSSDGFRIRKRW